VALCRNVLPIAIALIRLVACDPETKIIRDRTGDRPGNYRAVIVRNEATNLSLESRGGTLRNQVDRAADRVAAIQCALGTAKDLEAVDINIVPHQTRGRGRVETIKIDGHAPFGGAGVG